MRLKKVTPLWCRGQTPQLLEDGKDLFADRDVDDTLCVGPGLKRSDAKCPHVNFVPYVYGILEPRCPSCFAAHIKLVRAGKGSEK